MIATANTQQRNNASPTQHNAQREHKQARKPARVFIILLLYYNKVTAQAPTQATAQKTSWTQHKRQRKTGNNQRTKNEEGNKRLFSSFLLFVFLPAAATETATATARDYIYINIV